MANMLLVAALLVAADVLGCMAIGPYLRPCPFPAGDGDSSALVPGTTDPGYFCLPLSTYAVWGVAFLIGVLMGVATSTIFFFLFADDIMKAAGYVTIRGDPEAGGKIQ